MGMVVKYGPDTCPGRHLTAVIGIGHTVEVTLSQAPLSAPLWNRTMRPGSAQSA